MRGPDAAREIIRHLLEEGNLEGGAKIYVCGWVGGVLDAGSHSATLDTLFAPY